MMATYNNNNNNNAHPLPAAPVGGASMLPPPVQQMPQQQQQYSGHQSPQQQPVKPQMSRRESQASASRGGRPKSRSFSFRSDRSQSQKGSNSGPMSQKLEPETHAEKEAKRLHTKADPTMAISEAEPSAVAATVKSNMAPLRSIVHRDNNGNPIAEPDKSNPTRYRWERPLDTIRSFEAAIDGGYTRKSSFSPSDNESNANFSRRNSYYTQTQNNARYPQDSYYGRPQSHMPTSNSAYDLRQSLHGRDSYQDGGYNNGGYYNNANGNGNRRYSRIASEPMIHGHMGMNGNSQIPNVNGNGNGIYPIPNNHRSYETVASGAGSSGTSGEPAGYQTDPTSSDNSSIERRQSPNKPHMNMNQTGPYGGGAYPPGANTYGYNGNGYNSSNMNGGGPKRNSPPIQLSSAPMQQQQQPQMGGAAMPPSKNLITRKPTNLSQQTSAQTLTAPAPANEKRKSWFSKRFSRQH